MPRLAASAARRGHAMSDDDALEDSTELELVDDIPPATKRRRLDASSAPAPPLRGVAIAISGIQNPHRSKLREIALRLGATYSGAWDERTTTHLICAFAGTPKFNEVSASGKGVIVRPEWLEECDNAGRRLPEAEFAVQRGRSSTRVTRRSFDANMGDATAPGSSAGASRLGPSSARDKDSDSRRDSDRGRGSGGSHSLADGTAAGAAAPAAAGVSAPAAGMDEPVDSGDETEELVDHDTEIDRDISTGRDAVRHGDGDRDPGTAAARSSSASAMGVASLDDDAGGWASDSTERLDDSEVAQMRASFTGDGPHARAAEALRWSCVGLAGSGLSLPDFFRGVVAYLPRTDKWSAQQPPLDYRLVGQFDKLNWIDNSNDC